MVETAKDIILKCVNALELVPEITAIPQLADWKFYARLITLLKKKDVSPDTESMVSALESIVKEHFAGPNMVSIEHVASGNEAELIKLTLLLLYITFVTSVKLNKKLIHLMDSSTQLKLKYLLESIQKRGSGMSVKFLNILCEEEIDIKNTPRCQTPVNSSFPCGSPNVFTYSPKSGATSSPLRELILSPPFRMQKLLNAKAQEVKSLQQQIHSKEDENQNLEIRLELAEKKVSKLSTLLTKCQDELKDQRHLREELELKLSGGEDLVQQQIHRLSNELSVLRKEKSNLEDTVQRIIDDNDELGTKNNSLHNRLTLTAAERNRLEEELLVYIQAKKENECIIEAQVVEIHDVQLRLVELQDVITNMKSSCPTIHESFECDSPLQMDASPCPENDTSMATDGENLGDVVIDKMLTETRDQLSLLKEQHTLLQNQLKETSTQRDELHARVESLSSENGNLTTELGEVQLTFSNLSEAQEQLRERYNESLRNFQQSCSKIEELDAQNLELKTAVGKLEEISSGLQQNLTSCNNKYKEVEEKLCTSNQDLEFTQKELLEVNRMNAEKQLQIEGLENDFKVKVAAFEQTKKELLQENSDNHTALLALGRELEAEKERYDNSVKETKVLSNFLAEEQLLARENIKGLENSLSSMKQDMEKVIESKDVEQKKHVKELEMKQMEFDCLLNEKNNVVEKYEQEMNINCGLLKDKESSTETIKALENSVHSLQQDMEKMVQSHCAEIEKQCNDTKLKQAEVENLKEEMDKLANTYEKEKEELNRVMLIEKEVANKTVVALEEDITSLKQNMDATVTSLTVEKEDFSKRIAQKQNELESLKEEMGDIVKRMDKERLELSNELLLEKESSAKKIEALDETHSLLEQKVESILEKSKEEKNELERNLLSERALASEKVKELEDEFMSLKHSMETAVQSLNDEKETLSRDNAVKQTMLESLNKEKTEDLDRFEKEMMQLNEALSQEKASSDEKIQSMDKALSSIKQDFENVTQLLDAERENHSREIGMKKVEYENLKKDMEENLRRYEDESERRNSVILQEKTAASENIKMLEDKLNLLKQDLENAGQSYYTEKENLCKEIEKKQMELESQEKDRSDLLKKHEVEKLELNNMLLQERTSASEAIKSLKEDMIHAKKEAECNNKSHNEEKERQCKEVELKYEEFECMKKEMDLQLKKREEEISGMNSMLLTERATAAENIKSLEDSLNCLKQKLDETIKSHDVERETQVKMIEQKQKEFDCLKEEIANHMRKWDDEKSSLNNLVKEKDDFISSHQKSADEAKESLLQSMREKENSKAELKQEMENVVTLLNNEKEKAVAAKDEIIADLVKEKEEMLECMKKEKDNIKLMNDAKEDTVLQLQQRIQENDVIRTEKDSLIQKLTLLQEEHTSLVKTHESSKESFDNEMKLLKKQMEEKTTLYLHLQERIKLNEEDNMREVQKVHNSMEKASVEVSEFKNLNSELTEKLQLLEKVSTVKEEQLNNEITNLKLQLAKEIEVLKSSISDKEDNICNYQRQNKEITEKHNLEIKDLEATLKDRMQMLEALKEDKTELQNEKKLTEDKIDSLNIEISKIKSSFDNERELLNKQIKEKTMLYVDLQEQIKLKEEDNVREVQKVHNTIEKSSAEVSECKNLNLELTEKLQSLENASADKEEELKELTRIKQEFAEEIVLLKSSISEKEDNICDLQRQTKEMSERHSLEFKNLEATLSDKMQMLKDLKQDKADLQNDKRLNQEEIQSLNTEISNIKSSFDNEKELLNKNIEEKTALYLDLQKGIKIKDEDNVREVQKVQDSMEKASAEVSEYKNLSSELTEKLELLEKASAGKEEEFNKEMTHIKQEFAEEIKLLKCSISEKEDSICDLQRQNQEMTEKHHLEVKDLEAKLSDTMQILEALKEDKIELQNNEKLSEEKIQSLNTEISNIKSRLMSFEETLNEKENSLEKDLTKLLSDKEKMEKTHDAAIHELNGCLMEKSKAIEDLEEQLKVSRSALDCMELSMKQEKESLMARLDEKTEAVENLQDKVKSMAQESKQQLSKIRTQEVMLIDKEKDVAAAEEEIMRVERESEKSARSLTEELQAAKEKYREERQTIVDKMKSSYKTELEKIMLKMEEQEKIQKENKIFRQKYDVAKKKLSETLMELNEVKRSNEQFEVQVTKYKEHMNKVSESLKKEQANNAELSELHHPLKEKLKESEQRIRRLDGEKRSLETQLQFADTQMREMKQQLNRDGLDPKRVPPSRRNTKSAVSDSQLVRISVSSASSVEDDWMVNNSKEELLSKRASMARSRSKVLPRVASAETVFKKPEAQLSSAEASRRSINVANLAAKASARNRRETNLGKSVSDKSLGQSVPQDMLFNCEDEDEWFSNKYLHDMQSGRCNLLEDAQKKRLSELQRRNSLYPPHMRSAYPAELQFAPLEDFDDDKLRAGRAVDDSSLLNLTEAAENLNLDSPAFNLRKRKSLSDSTNSEVSLDSVGGRKNKRLSTSYSRPGPPTPARRTSSRSDKENRAGHDISQATSSIGRSPDDMGSRRTLRDSVSRVSLSSSQLRRTTMSPGGVSFLSKKGLNITPGKGKGMTPSSIRKLLRGKSPWRKLNNEEETPKGLSGSNGSTGSSKLRIFRKPFGSRNYNVLSASLRSQENPLDQNSSAASAGRSEVKNDKLRPRR